MRRRPGLLRLVDITLEEGIMPRATDHLLRQHLDSLGVHLRQCRTLSDRRLRMLLSLEAIDGAVAPRLFTTAAMVGVFIALFLGFSS
jgi:hypothetical protein